MDYFFKQRNLSGQDMVRVPYIFHLAVQANNQSLAFDLLMLKPELASSFDSRGQTPIVTAFIHGNYEIVEKLLRFDPSICRLPSQGGLNILHHIVRGERSLDQLLVKVLINCPECINDKTLDLKNVFHFAAGRNTSSYLDYLLGHLYFLDDIDVKDNFLNMRDIHGDTPLHVAVRKNNFEVILFNFERRCLNGFHFSVLCFFFFLNVFVFLVSRHAVEATCGGEFVEL